MDIFGVGPLEVLLVVLLALVLFGPRELTKNARSAGRFLNRLYKSEAWRTMNEASSALRNLPNRLAREAELDELGKVGRDLNDIQRPPAEVPPPPASPSPTPDLAAWIPDKPPPAPPGVPPDDPR